LSLNFFFGFQSTFSFFPASKKNALPSSLQVKDGGSIYIYIAFRIVLCILKGKKQPKLQRRSFFVCFFSLFA